MSTPKTEITSLADWRQNPQLLGWAFKTFNRPEWKLLIQVMQEAEHVRLHDSGIAKDASERLGQIVGWDLFNSTLKTAAMPLALQSEMPPATFQPEEPEPVEKE